MTPYDSFPRLLFTCVDGSIKDVVNTVLTGLNRADEWSPRNGRGEPITQYFVRPAAHDISSPYVSQDENGSAPLCVRFWEPANHSNKAAFIGNHADGMSHSVFRLSEYSLYAWVNVRICENQDYPACFFDYYAQHRTIERRLVAGKFEEGWEFIEKGPVQAFENKAYYERPLRKDRLTREIITEYLEKLGFMIRDESFWRTDQMAYFLWQERPTAEEKC